MPDSAARDSQSWIPLFMLAAGVALLYLLWHVLLIFILAGLVAFILFPVIRLFDRKLPHVFSILTVYLLLAIVLILAAGLIAPVVSRQFSELVDNIPEYIEQARVLFDDLQERYGALPARWRGVVDRALTELQQTAIRLTRQAIPAALAFVSGLFTLVFVPFLSFFMLLDHKGYRNMILAVTPRRHRDTVSDLLTCTGQALWNFIKGQFILMSVVGVFTGAGLYFAGMPYAAVFGVLAGLLEIVPNFGPIASSVIVGVVGLLISPILALKALGVTITVQLIENFFLAPVVMGKAVGLDPITVAFAIFIGGSAAGVLGALIAIPLAVLIKIVLLYFYAEDSALPKGQPGICRPSRQKAKQRRRR